jgi:hypothetical protein
LGLDQSRLGIAGDRGCAYADPASDGVATSIGAGLEFIAGAALCQVSGGGLGRGFVSAYFAVARLNVVELPLFFAGEICLLPNVSLFCGLSGVALLLCFGAALPGIIFSSLIVVGTFHGSCRSLIGLLVHRARGRDGGERVL